MKIGIIPHTGKPVAMNLTEELVDFLEGRGVDFQIITGPTRSNVRGFDIMIVLGGDGTY